MKLFLFVVGLKPSIIGLILTLILLSFRITNLLKASFPRTVEKVTSTPDFFKCEATIAAPPIKLSSFCLSKLKVGVFVCPPINDVLV